MNETHKFPLETYPQTMHAILKNGVPTNIKKEFIIDLEKLSRTVSFNGDNTFIIENIKFSNVVFGTYSVYLVNNKAACIINNIKKIKNIFQKKEIIFEVPEDILKKLKKEYPRSTLKNNDIYKAYLLYYYNIFFRDNKQLIKITEDPKEVNYFYAYLTNKLEVVNSLSLELCYLFS